MELEKVVVMEMGIAIVNQGIEIIDAVTAKPIKDTMVMDMFVAKVTSIMYGGYIVRVS